MKDKDLNEINFKLEDEKDYPMIELDNWK